MSSSDVLFQGIGRAPRTSQGGLIYHVLNRSNGRLTVFEKDRGYAAFERILQLVPYDFTVLLREKYVLTLCPQNYGPTAHIETATRRPPLFSTLCVNY